MDAFEHNKHIKNSKDLKGLIKGLKLSPQEKKDLFKLAKPEVLRPSGISEKEMKKIVDKADKENIIDHKDAYHIKKYGK